MLQTQLQRVTSQLRQQQISGGFGPAQEGNFMSCPVCGGTRKFSQDCAKCKSIISTRPGLLTSKENLLDRIRNFVQVPKAATQAAPPLKQYHQNQDH